MRELWKRWSVKFAAAMGMFVTLAGSYVVQDPTVVPRIVAFVPEGWRPVAVILGGFLTFAIPTLIRAAPQPKLRQDGGDTGP